MRNFTREGAAVSSGHTQRLEYPYPRHTPGGGRGGTAGGAGCATAGGLPGGGRGYGARGYLRRGGAGAAGSYPKRGDYGAHVGRGYRARTNTGAAGYRGKQSAFRGKHGVFPGGYRARGATGGAGGYLCRGGAYTGARLPRRAARRHSLPRAGRLPGGCTPGEDHCFPAACDGFSPHQISVCVPRRLPRRGYPAARRKKIFFPGAGFCAGIPASRILRAYIEAGRPGGATGILIRQKPPEKLVLFGTCFFRRPE